MEVNLSMSMRGDLPAVMRALVARRKALGVRQADIAEAVGVGQQYISTIERGLFGPSFDQLQRYAAALGAEVRIEVLFSLGENVRSDGP